MGPSARRAISIECSEDTLPQVAPGLSTVEKIDALTKLAHTEYRVEVVFVIYQGMTSAYAGGRIQSASPEATEQAANTR